MANVGSPRLNGNTNYLVGQALQEATKLGAQTEKIVLSQYKLGPSQGTGSAASSTVRTTLSLSRIRVWSSKYEWGSRDYPKITIKL